MGWEVKRFGEESKSNVSSADGLHDNISFVSWFW
jgi:hypothetical protein